ncbi:MAG: hypothetical protein JNL82_16895 [Myxococcales bacterium]|nr:hypothetical protein [Myxococcales bacterium]
MLSGVGWTASFPTSNSTGDLAGDFRGNVERFLAALVAAGATRRISATLRPPKRAFLMHYAYRIAVEGLDPADVPAHPEIDIQWVHTRADAPDLLASREAAQAMVSAYGIVDRPALTSRHIEGLAIDVTISWTGDLTVALPDGTTRTITTTPRTGMNAELKEVGALYGVIKSRRGAKDPPHWSSDGF